LSKGARARLMGPKPSSQVASTLPHRDTLGARSAGWGHVTARERLLCEGWPRTIRVMFPLHKPLLSMPVISVMRAVTRIGARPIRALAAALAPGRWISSYIVPAALALTTFIVFLPALNAGFVNWDDDINFLNNGNYRGLGAAQLQWMFTTFLMGHYIPLTWMTFGLDYVVWGMNPAGYHLTNILLHAANAVLFYFVALHLLRLSASRHLVDRSSAPIIGSAFATLLFAVHPLRAESVAWITERRDVLSGFLCLAVVLTYLQYCSVPDRQTGRTRYAPAWYWASLGFFALALLSKSMAMTLPAILLLLDAYPLRRLGVVGSGRRWLPSTSAVVEKLPFFLLSLVAAYTSLVALDLAAQVASRSGAITWDADATVEMSSIDRIAVSANALFFYLWKMAVPLHLSPFYELPPPAAFETWPALISFAVVCAVTAIVIVGHRRRPALAAVWVGCIVMLSPVIWVPQIAADRYTYLACTGWALLCGGGLASAWRYCQQCNIDARARASLAGLALAVVAALGVLTWNQVGVWRDSETLWAHGVAVWPSSWSHFKLGEILAQRGDLADAIENFEAALRIDPRNTYAHTALGFAFTIQDRLTEALEQYDDALRIGPRFASAHTGLGLVFARQGKLSEASDQFRRALEIDAGDAQAHINLGLILKKQGQRGKAAAHFQQAVQADPNSEQAQYQWGLALAEEGKLSEATDHLRAALRINPRSTEVHRSLAEVLMREGRSDEAEEQLQEARRLPP
jgi:protein O-mannosyl-transferase